MQQLTKRPKALCLTQSCASVSSAPTCTRPRLPSRFTHCDCRQYMVCAASHFFVTTRWGYSSLCTRRPISCQLTLVSAGSKRQLQANHLVQGGAHGGVPRAQSSCRRGSHLHPSLGYTIAICSLSQACCIRAVRLATGPAVHLAQLSCSPGPASVLFTLTHRWRISMPAELCI